ncbi:hypothetical protein GO730_20005 [Spirosoma sp. HMF3257]|uniref:Uncharacterized protein n=1 Tax=Spirosoma telluris TaxID=2183553 RepID=A0A327NQ01_9BACT|nr:hypothetical protein [Spirosoma telluris]RAI75864.1 hypothetical protein HMF3257_19935 [Spirosoma telluris]
MSSERFDKLMKKQLESVRPGYDPSAWDRFQKRLPLVGFWPWLFRYGGWALSGLMLTGWLTTLYSLHENQQLMRQLSKTLARPALTTMPAPVASGSTPTLTHRVDTVYIVKRTVVEHRHFYRVPGSLPAEENPLAQTDSPDLSVEPLTGQNERLPETTISSSKAASGRLQPKVGSKQRTGLVTNQPTLAARSGEKATNRARPGVILRTLADSTQVLINNNVLPEETLSTPNQPVPTELSSQPNARPDSVSVTPKQGTVTTPAAAQTQPTQQRRPVFQFSSLKPRVGITTMVAPHGVGVGPVIELFPGESLGLSVGLLASQLRSENHRGLNDFNSATGKEFINQYQAFLPAQYDRIEDISIQTSVISLPISLTYYVPLRRRWSLLFQTGTSFDLSAYQQVLYESYFRGTEQHNSFEVKVKPQIFHNFMFGAGLQFHKSRISGQLIPYYLYDFRRIVNTPNGSNFGLKAAVWLDLFGSGT